MPATGGQVVQMRRHRGDRRRAEAVGQIRVHDGDDDLRCPNTCRDRRGDLGEPVEAVGEQRRHVAVRIRTSGP